MQCLHIQCACTYAEMQIRPFTTVVLCLLYYSFKVVTQQTQSGQLHRGCGVGCFVLYTSTYTHQMTTQNNYIIQTKCTIHSSFLVTSSLLIMQTKFLTIWFSSFEIHDHDVWNWQKTLPVPEVPFHRCLWHFWLIFHEDWTFILYLKLTRLLSCSNPMREHTIVPTKTHKIVYVMFCVQLYWLIGDTYSTMLRDRQTQVMAES